jgi:hypothetical protein
MMFPHASNFRYGSQITFAVAAGAGVLGAIVPGDPLWQRIASPVFAFVMVGGGFAAGWLILKFFAVILGRIAPSIVRAIGLLYFYMAPVGAVLQLVFSALDPAGIQGQEISLREMILFVPAAVGVSAGVRRVLQEYAVAV